LGDRIPLHGWSKFRGGLDVQNGTTGESSVFFSYNSNPIMFHVSTLLPFNPKEKQQLERKRHIGNDLVVIVFQEGNKPFLPSSIASRMVHVIFVVRKVSIEEQEVSSSNVYYSLTVIRKEGVPPFAPLLPNKSIHKKGPEFKDLLYKKIVEC